MKVNSGETRLLATTTILQSFHTTLHSQIYVSIFDTEMLIPERGHVPLAPGCKVAGWVDF